MTTPRSVLVIVGPTASGKTTLAVETSLAMGGEVVSADSMQIYRGMDIGTAKPTLSERKGIPHHLMDMVAPDQAFSVADWQKAAREAVTDILARGRLPVVAGGTGLYVNSLVHNLQFNEASGDDKFREEMRLLAEAQGVAAVHALLAEADPESAARVHPNNLVRVIRTLEVVRATGVPMRVHLARSRQVPSPWRFVLVGLLPERDVLYERINRRVDLMLAAGLEQEVDRLLDAGFSTTLQAMQGIGYKELAAWRQGLCTHEEALERIRQGSRNYAKRQITWFSRLEGMVWMNPDLLSTEDLLGRVRDLLESETGIG